MKTNADNKFGHLNVRRGTFFFHGAFCLWLLCLSAWITGTTGCAVPVRSVTPGSGANVTMKVSPSQYPGFTDDLNFDGMRFAVEQSLAYLKTLPADRLFHFGNDTYQTLHLIASLNRFLNFIDQRPSAPELQTFITSHYHVYRSAGSDGEGRILFTGYYEPIYRGSRYKTKRFSVPVHARPRDLVSIDLSLFSADFKGRRIIGRNTGQRIVPYFDRNEIEASGVLAETADILAWLEDPVDLFFLQIQGSGKIYLADGSMLRVHYHTSNGRPYRSIGKRLIDTGKISRSNMSMQSIRSYLREHPEELRHILNYNPSYVFFKTETQGPLGCLNVPLTPGRSLAMDRRLFPPAALAFIQTRKPLTDADGHIDRWAAFSRFVLNQDTGGAIRGAGRADLFWGNGPYAEIAAGHMQHDGRLFFLVLKPEISQPPGLHASSQNTR